MYARRAFSHPHRFLVPYTALDVQRTQQSIQPAAHFHLFLSCLHKYQNKFLQFFYPQ